jgi:hypothetical protein
MARRRGTEQDKERDKAFFAAMWKLIEKRLPQLAAFPESTDPVQNLERLEKGSRSLARK